MSQLQLLGCLLFLALTFSGRTTASTSLEIRVVDVGSGSCSIAKLPDNEGIVIFDAGYWRGSRCLEALKSLNGNKTIRLMVLSRSDADHIGDAASILSKFQVEHLLRTEVKRRSKTWLRYDQAVIKTQQNGTKIYDASRTSLPGLKFKFGDVTAVVLYGEHTWNGEPLSKSEARNAVSKVVRLEYAGQSILFPGDSIGRDSGSSADSCLYSEKALLVKAASEDIDMDILLYQPKIGTYS